MKIIKKFLIYLLLISKIKKDIKVIIGINTYIIYLEWIIGLKIKPKIKGTA